MNSIIWIVWIVALALTARFSRPRSYERVAGMESGEPGAEVALRRAQSIAAALAAMFIAIRSDFFRAHPNLHTILGAILALVWLEFGVRVFFKRYAPRFSPESKIRRWERWAHDFSTTMGPDFAWLDPRPHPFLHFTGLRWTSGGERGLGFAGLAVRDIAKPAGVIRIACLGNSTTYDGYPEQLQAFLDQCGGGRRFQVLNFGLGWWLSVHTMVNFVLNVREFHPDVVVVHDNCNDEKARGFPGLRGDYAHAMDALAIKRHRDEWLYRFSILYRFAILMFNGIRPRKYYYPKIGIGMRRDRERISNFAPEELRLLRRNLETICDLAAPEGTRVVMMTMPFSKILQFTDADEIRFHPHLRGANEILRQVARERTLDLIDLEALFADKDFFLDSFHLKGEGVAIKALEVGTTVLHALGVTSVLDAHWREVEASRPAASAIARSSAA